MEGINGLEWADISLSSTSECHWKMVPTVSKTTAVLLTNLLGPVLVSSLAVKESPGLAFRAPGKRRFTLSYAGK